MELNTFSIPTFRKEDITKRLEKLVRKAQKYGNPDIQFEFGKTEVREVQTEYGTRKIEYIDITVSGEAPRIAGWELVARIELLQGNENLVHTLPGQTLIGDYRTHNGHCDHCNSLRRRNDVYVMSSDDQQIAVGRSCLRDFLGTDDPNKIVRRAQFFEELRAIEDEDMLGGFGSSGYFDLQSVLLIAAAFIRRDGYVSKARQAETGYETTGQSVIMNLGGFTEYQLETTDEDRAWATKTIEMFRVTEPFGNDYMDNIRVLMKQDILHKRHIALVSSAVITAQRKLAEKEQTRESNFVGDIKQRLKSLELSLDRIIPLGSGMFGPSYLHLFKDSDDNVFSWITGNKIQSAEGSTVVVDATVKQHRVYNGVNQTVLTRAKVH